MSVIKHSHVWTRNDKDYAIMSRSFYGLRIDSSLLRNGTRCDFCERGEAIVFIDITVMILVPNHL